jgi:hypothetical protein
VGQREDLDQAVTFEVGGKAQRRIMIDTLHAHRSHVPASALSALPREWFTWRNMHVGRDPTDRVTPISRTRRERVRRHGGTISAFVREMPQTQSYR